jgi:PAS domain S-box-containing protein
MAAAPCRRADSDVPPAFLQYKAIEVFKDFLYTLEESSWVHRKSLASEGSVMALRFPVCRVLPIILMSVLLNLTAERVQGEPLVIRTKFDYPPYSYQDKLGRPVGFTVDLTRAIAEVMGLEVRIESGPWREIRQALENDEIDAIAGMYYSKDRDRKVDFTPPYVAVTHAIFVHGDSPPIFAVGDLRDKRIIVMQGDIMHDFAAENELGSSLTTVPTQTEALRLLAEGDHDCALLAKLPGYYWIDKLGLDGVEATGPPLRASHYCFAVAEDDRQLQAVFAEGLALLASSGRLQAMYDHWLGSLEPERIQRRTVLKYLVALGGPILLLLAFTAGRAMVLKRQVAVSTRDLTERTKELSCIYGIAEATIRLEKVDALLDEAANLIPSGWQFSELACARIIFDGQAHASRDFTASPWFQSCDLEVGGERRGSVDVFYREECPPEDEGPFLAAERRLLTALSRLLGKAIQAKIIEGQFLVEKAHYRQLFHQMLNGFAVHKIICDEQGAPVDYLFLDVNPAFEKMTRLKRDDVVGRTVREIIPDTEQFWIDRYGKVALTGESIFFQSYSQGLAKHFEVSAFQSAPGQFACVIGDITKRKLYEESLASHRRRLSSLAAQLASTEDLLRQEIAAGLHDSIGQDLAALKLRVDMMGRSDGVQLLGDPVQAGRTMNGISRDLDSVVQKVWALAFQLSPPGLYEAGLVPALEWLVEHFNQEQGPVFELEFPEDLPVLAKQVRGLLFQVVRELLTNAAKHAAARMVMVALSSDGEKIQIVVKDDGTGFDPAAILAGSESAGGFGLFSIRERLAFQGGELDIESRTGVGTQVTIRFPLIDGTDPSGERSDEEYHDSIG